MFLDLALGPLTEPVTGKHWDRDVVRAQYRRRLAFFSRHGLRAGDRVCLHYGNTPEFFVDLMAIWCLGGCVIPIEIVLWVEERVPAGLDLATFDLAEEWDTVARLVAFIERHAEER